ncbi:hypothetical protein HDU83_002674 [Entophlyctis luteolus]|nr:hypothetical protein HDU83_002674 [Entophlyctis luteolus]
MSPRRVATGNQLNIGVDEFHNHSPELKKRPCLDDEDPANKRRRQVRKRQQTHTEELEARVASLTAVLHAHGITVPHAASGRQATAVVPARPSACCGAFSELADENRVLQMQLEEQTQKCRDLSAALAALRDCRPAAPPLFSLPVKQATSPAETVRFSATAHHAAPKSTDASSLVMPMNPRPRRVPPMRTTIAGLVESDDIISSAEMFGHLQLEAFAQNMMMIGVREDWAKEFVRLLQNMSLCTNRCILRSLLVSLGVSKTARNEFESLGPYRRPKISLILAYLFAGFQAHWYQSIAANLEFDSIMERNSPHMPEAQAKLVKDFEIIRKELSAIPSIADRGHLALTTCYPDRYEKHYANVLAIQGLLQGLCETKDERRMV